MSSESVFETDVLVIGGGTAGCFAAIKAKEQGLDVTIVDKAYVGKSGASITASGSWTVFNPEWGFDFDASMNEINKSGEYLNNREWSEIVLKESWATYQDLISWGVEFPLEADKRKDYSMLSFSSSSPSKRIGISKVRVPFSLIPLRHRKTTPFLRKQAEKVSVKVMDRILTYDVGAKCSEINNTGVEVVDKGGKAKFIEADTVVYAVGMKPRNEVVESFRSSADWFVAVGDCVKARSVEQAVYEGFIAAMDII